MIPVSFLKICSARIAKKKRPPGGKPPRVPGTTPKWVGSCQVIEQLNLESVLELVEDSVVVVIVIVVIADTIVVVIELPGQIVSIVGLVPIR